MRQKLLLLAVVVVIFFGYQSYSQRKPSFPCETIRNNPLYTLNSEYVREIGRKNRFIEWVNDWYGTEPQEENPSISWEKEGIRYQAYFNGVNLEFVILNLDSFEAKVSDITACFGAPSITLAEAVSTDRGLLNLTHLWYDTFRIIITATSPTTEPAGALLALDETAEVITLSWFTIPSYELEKP